MTNIIKEIVVNLLSSPIVWGVILTGLFVLIGYIIHKTKTKKDDTIWHAIQGMVINAFNIAEKAIPDTSKGTFGKIDIALKTFTEEYRKRNGKAPDEGLVNFAKDEFAILAREAKKK